jgi:hypothetical protein
MRPIAARWCSAGRERTAYIMDNDVHALEPAQQSSRFWDNKAPVAEQAYLIGPPRVPWWKRISTDRIVSTVCRKNYIEK